MKSFISVVCRLYADFKFWKKEEEKDMKRLCVLFTGGLNVFCVFNHFGVKTANSERDTPGIFDRAVNTV